jgi:hypothetical protein
MRRLTSVSVLPRHLEPMRTGGHHGDHDEPGESDLCVGAGQRRALGAGRGLGWGVPRPAPAVEEAKRSATHIHDGSSGARPAPSPG